MVGPRGSAGDEAESAGKGGLVLGSIHKLWQRGQGGIYLFLLLQNFFSRWNPVFFLHGRLTIIVFRAIFTCLTVTSRSSWFTGSTSRVSSDGWAVGRSWEDYLGDILTSGI